MSVGVILLVIFFSFKVPTTNCGTLMGPTSLGNITTHNSANDLAMIDLLETTIRSPMIELGLMNLSGAIGHVGWLEN